MVISDRCSEFNSGPTVVAVCVLTMLHVLPPLQVIRSSSFWGLVKVTADLGYLAEFPGRWSEGCKCCSAHRLVYATSSRRERLSLPAPPDCIYRGCRSAELASSEFWETMENVARMIEPRLLSYMHEFECSGGMSAIVAKDWQRSIGFVMMGISTKLSFWRELPYVLCGLASSHPAQVAQLKHRIRVPR